MENRELNLQLVQYRVALKNLAYKFTSDPDEIQDLVQETMLRALKYIDQFFQNPKIISWLFVIMKNIYINHYRNRQQQRKYESHSMSTFQDKGCLEPFTENIIEGKLILKDIKKALAQFPSDHSDMFTRYINGYKYKELADIYGIPEGTIKSRIHIMRKNLQKKLALYR
ncbi:MAG TPA: RNA polymerase sigma factor [Sphingobacterium sp.]|nr:RNA polymerase sigma factor [Sphingobacterium sp.]